MANMRNSRNNKTLKSKSCMMLLTSQGSSLIQVVVMLGIASITISASLTMVQKARQDQKNIANKIEHRSIEALVKGLISRDSECNCQFLGQTINLETADKSFPITTLKASCAAGAPDLITTISTSNPKTIRANSMEVNNITPTTNANEYTGELHVAFKTTQDKYNTQFKTEPIKFTFHTDPTTPDIKKAILGCGRSPLIAPSKLNGAAGPLSNECTFTWNEASGAKTITYTVRGSTTAGKASTGTKICQVQDTTTCKISGLTKDIKHYFTIQASNNTQGTTTYSPEITCTPLMAASIPILNSPTAGDTKCSLSWSTSSGSGPITYTVFRSDTLPITSSSTKICTKISGKNCSDTGLDNGVTYYYAVVATNGLGDSNFSNSESCTPFSTP